VNTGWVTQRLYTPSIIFKKGRKPQFIPKQFTLNQFMGFNSFGKCKTSSIPLLNKRHPWNLYLDLKIISQFIIQKIKKARMFSQKILLQKLVNWSTCSETWNKPIKYFSQVWPPSPFFSYSKGGFIQEIAWNIMNSY
jgi:hypothetical protein